MSIALKVENLSKLYRLGEIGTGTLSHDLHRWWAKRRGQDDPFLKVGETNDQNQKGTSDFVWSLRDLNFEIQQGDAVGIIGRNGAGKSTLLKILSRVTSPTKGLITGEGRIASLLEVGTGFHPELSGRENIFLNGAILGMRKKEIKRRFDEIVDFAGVDRYIDTPVKRYSSGMYVRLAFAVAAHLDSEILIVDEVLAVGDAEFQKKCLGKMGEVSKGEGRTVLFVSHNMASINSLCTRSVVLQNGRLIYDGTTEKGIHFYLETINRHSSLQPEIDINTTHLTNYISAIKTTNESEIPRNEFGSNENVYLSIETQINEHHPSLEIGLALYDRNNNRVFTIHEILNANGMKKREKAIKIKIEVPQNFLAPGRYSWLATIHIPHQQQFHLLENVCAFQIVDVGTEFANFEGQDLGVVMPNYNITFSNK